MGQQQLLLIILGVIIVGIAIAVGLSLFSAQSVQSNKDAIINDINNLAAYCYQFKIRPASMGGGNQFYNLTTLPSKLASNSNATYTITGGSATATTLTIQGASVQDATNGTVSVTLNADGTLGPTWTYGTYFQ